MSLLTNSSSAFTSVTQDAAGVGAVTANTLTIDAAPGFPVPDTVDLSFANNKIGTLVVNAGDVSLRVANNPGVPLVLSGSGPFSFNVTAVDTSVTQPAGPLGALTIGAGEGHFNITTTGSGDVTLTNPANQITAGMTFNVAGNVNVVNSGAFSRRRHGDRQRHAAGGRRPVLHVQRHQRRQHRHHRRRLRELRQQRR